MFGLQCQIRAKRLVIVSSLDHPLGTHSQQSMIRFRLDIPDHSDQSYVDVLEIFLLTQFGELLVVLVDVIVSADSISCRPKALSTGSKDSPVGEHDLLVLQKSGNVGQERGTCLLASHIVALRVPKAKEAR
jgi:hypothetical protein